MHRFVARGASLLMSLLIAACGGGGENTEQSSGPLPRPQAAAVSADHCTESAAATGQYRQSAEGCFRSSAALGLSIPAAPREGVAPALTAAQAMDWAEQTYPTLFPKAGRTEGYIEPYSYRHYPGSGNYLGISTGAADVAIYVLGPITGGEIARIAALADFTCVILPQSCQLAVTPSALSLQAIEGGSQQAELALTLPAVGGGSWRAEVERSAADTSWLSVAVKDSYTVRITAQAGELAPTSRSGAVTVIYTPTSGASKSVRIPVNLNVVQGLVGPPAQLLVLDANATTASLSATVPVTRGDGATAPWSAVSSEPWLTLSPSGSLTPATLGFAVDAAQAAALANGADHTTVVTLSAPGLRQASFRVTLRKQLPSLWTAMPYGIPAGRKSHVVVGGSGFSQISDVGKALKAAGLTLTNVRAISDGQLEFDVTPAAAGSYTLSIGGSVAGAASQVPLRVTSADGYAASSWAHPGDDFLSRYVHDPVRQAVYGLTNSLGSAVYKFQYRAGQWTAQALPVTKPANLGLTPDGTRLVVATEGALKLIDPDTFRITDSIATTAEIQQGYGGPLAATADNRLWLPGSYFANHMGYLDLRDNTVKTLPVTDPRVGYIESADFIASADGSRMLVSPDYSGSPRDPWYLYASADASVTNPMGSTEFWYDARMSADGSRVAMQYTGELYDARYELLGKLPTAPAGVFWSRLALTPDGSRIAVLAAQDSIITSIEVFSTTALVPGTTSFQKLASIPVTQQSANCRPDNSPYDVYGCTTFGHLIATQDNRALIWMGNKRVQVFKLP